MQNIFTQNNIVLLGIDGGYIYGTTPAGKRFVIQQNHGTQKRSNENYSLWIAGPGTVITSGSVSACIEKIKAF